MTDTPQNAQLAQMRLALRDEARRLLGDQYKPHMAELGGILARTARRTGKDVLQVAHDVCDRPGVGATEKGLILAAAVELIEPTGGPG